MISWRTVLSQLGFVKDSGLSTFLYRKDKMHSLQTSACLDRVKAAHIICPSAFPPIVWILETRIKLFWMTVRKFLHFLWPCWTLQHWLLNTPAEKKKATKSYKLSLCCLFLFPSPSFQSYPASWAALFTSSVDMKWSNHIYLNIHYRSCHRVSLLGKKIVFQERVLKLYGMDPLTR